MGFPSSERQVGNYFEKGGSEIAKLPFDAGAKPAGLFPSLRCELKNVSRCLAMNWMEMSALWKQGWNSA
ncbi:MAG: hypothetical protein Ct9H90mP9_0810 [Pseudomonadota bacterium]|nr:MAG: hypothetical protein Ct9H90mP9_0810 [Pseudomonadota bacterium]